MIKEKEEKTVPQHESERLRYQTTRQSFIKEMERGFSPKCPCINERSEIKKSDDTKR
jgi:hypothetical protein